MVRGLLRFSAGGVYEYAPNGSSAACLFDRLVAGAIRRWMTTLACPAKGSTEGYTWQFAGAVVNGNFRGEHGTAGEPGYLLIEGRIAEDGSAKLVATGIVASRNYARGILAHKGEDYSYNIKAQFKETEGSGTRNEGLGVVGRPCTFDFVRQ